MRQHGKFENYEFQPASETSFLVSFLTFLKTSKIQLFDDFLKPGGLENLNSGALGPLGIDLGSIPKVSNFFTSVMHP